ncbi:MAG: recombinase family protein [Eubacteriales bacterium]
MAQNRVIPFGYCMMGGENIVHQKEQEVVLKIFSQYAEGVSYKQIAEQLTLAQVPYLPEKYTWNKNMVARILKNVQYRGQDKYPQLVSEEQWGTTQQAMKPYTKTVSPEIKLLKPLMVCGVCGGEVERKLTPQGKERWRCVNDLHHISVVCSDQSILEQVKKLQWETQKHSPKDFKNKTVSLELVQLEKELRENKEISVEERSKKLHWLAHEKYKMCEEPPSVGEENVLEFIRTIQKVCVIGEEISEMTLKDETKIKKEGVT